MLIDSSESFFNPMRYSGSNFAELMLIGKSTATPIIRKSKDTYDDILIYIVYIRYIPVYIYDISYIQGVHERGYRN